MANFDIMSLLAQQGQNQQALQQAKLQAQREFFAPKHFGMGGTQINPSTGRENGNPFDTGFFASSAQRATKERAAFGTPVGQQTATESGNAWVNQNRHLAGPLNIGNVIDNGTVPGAPGQTYVAGGGISVNPQFATTNHLNDIMGINPYGPGGVMVKGKSTTRKPFVAPRM